MATDISATMTPIAAADTPPDSTAAAAMVAPVIDLDHLGSAVPVFNQGGVRSLQLVQDTVSVRNAGNGFHRADRDCDSRSAGQSEHTSQEKSSIHENLPIFDYRIIQHDPLRVSIHIAFHGERLVEQARLASGSTLRIALRKRRPGSLRASRRALDGESTTGFSRRRSGGRRRVDVRRYCTTSPCWVTSRPSTSSCFDGRRPTIALTT